MNIGISLKAYAFSHMKHEKLGSKSTQSLYTFIQSEVQKMTSGKSDKDKFKNHIQTMCTSADMGEKNVQSFKKTGLKLYEKLQSHGTHYLALTRGTTLFIYKG